MSGRTWISSEVAVMRADFPHKSTAEIAIALGRTYRQVASKAYSMGLTKTAEYLASPAAHRLDGAKGAGTRFGPGLSPWNKGLSGSTGTHERCRAHHFTKGNRPQTWLAVGSERVTKDGVLERKVADTRVKAIDWRPVHVLAWESVNGSVPPGHIVVFRRGMKTTDVTRITPDAVECITRAENMRRNTYHRYGPEIAGLIQLRGAINRQINKHTKESA